MGDEAKTEAKPASKLPIISDLEMDVFRIGSDFQRRFRSLGHAGKIPFDWNGHHKRRMVQPTLPPEYTYEFRSKFGLEESVFNDCVHGFMHEDVEAAKKRLALFDAPGEWLSLMKCKYTMGCYHCGQDVEIAFNGTSVRAVNRCKYPDGMPPITAIISVPSGKLVFVNYFDEVDPPSDVSHNAMGALAYKMETKHYAKHNIAYGACGNSCPSVWRNAKKDKLIIGNARYDEKDDEKIVDGFDGYVSVGHVVTDLWAWSAACFDTATKIGWEQRKDFGDDVVNVIPGKYRVSQLFHLVDYDNYKVKHKFATIERIGR